MAYYTMSLKEQWSVSQQDEEKYYKCYMICQKVTDAALKRAVRNLLYSRNLKKKRSKTALTMSHECRQVE